MALQHKLRVQLCVCITLKSSAEEVSFEWSRHRILSADSKVRTTLHVSVMVSGSETVKRVRNYIN